MKRKVPLWGKPQGYATLDDSATNGATLGVNVFRADGSIVTEADLAPATSTDEPVVGRTLWNLIADIPAIVSALVDLGTDGWIRKDGAGLTARALTLADLPAGVGGVPYEVADGSSYAVAASIQALYSIPIDLLGASFLDVSGALIEVT